MLTKKELKKNGHQTVLKKLSLKQIVQEGRLFSTKYKNKISDRTFFQKNYFITINFFYNSNTNLVYKIVYVGSTKRKTM